jgi:hypothetical protein
VSSGNPARFVTSGAINANTVELKGVNNVVYSGSFGHVLKRPRTPTPAVIDFLDGSEGTVDEARALGEVHISNTGHLTLGELDVGGSLIIGGASHVTARSLKGTTSFRLASPATLDHVPEDPAGLTVEGFQSVVIDTGASIDLDALGRTRLASMSVSAGGSYGGLGGASGNGVYGQYAAPAELGTGAGGKRGGGKLRMVLPGGVLTVNGTITANGDPAVAINEGGSSGGAIYITTSRLKGQGRITALGANGEDNLRGGGGGGRIAVVGLDADGGREGAFAGNGVFDNIEATGGGGTSIPGGAGTLFLRTVAQDWGDLILDNNTLPGLTPMVDLPTAQVGDVGVDAFNSYVLPTLMVSDAFNGYWLRPDVSQSDDRDLRDDDVLQVRRNTTNTFELDISGLTRPLTAVTAKNATFRPAFTFDNLEVRGGAQLRTTGDVLVWSGDLVSGNTTSFTLTGANTKLEAHFVDLNAAKEEGTSKITAQAIWNDANRNLP